MRQFLIKETSEKKALINSWSILIRGSTTKYYSSTTLYYKVLLQYYSVLHSTTPVLLCTTKYYSSTTLYYRVPVCTTQYYNVLLQYYPVLPVVPHKAAAEVSRRGKL